MVVEKIGTIPVSKINNSCIILAGIYTERRHRKGLKLRNTLLTLFDAAAAVGKQQSSGTERENEAEWWCTRTAPLYRAKSIDNIKKTSYLCTRHRGCPGLSWQVY